MTRPRSSATSRSAIRPTNATSCSTSSTATPAAAWRARGPRACRSRRARSRRPARRAPAPAGRERAPGQVEDLRVGDAALGRRPVDEVLDTERMQQRLGPTGGGPLVAPARRELKGGGDRRRPVGHVAGHDVLRAGEVGEHDRLLERPARPAAPGGAAAAGHVHTAELDVPASGREEPGAHVEQRGLARAVRADQGGDLARHDLRPAPSRATTPPKRTSTSRATSAGTHRSWFAARRSSSGAPPGSAPRRRCVRPATCRPTARSPGRLSAVGEASSVTRARGPSPAPHRRHTAVGRSPRRTGHRAGARR